MERDRPKRTVVCTCMLFFRSRTIDAIDAIERSIDLGHNQSLTVAMA